MNAKVFLFGFILILWAVPGSFSAEPGKTNTTTGHLHLTFSECNPAGSLEEICRRTSYANLQLYDKDTKISWKYDLANESFEAFIPSAYKPNVPYGLFVWISPDKAEVPVAWQEIFRRHKLIWISANNTGNDRPPPIRMGLALDALHNMKKLYNINKDRVYISGFSGGGKVASYLIHGYNDLFTGGYFMMGNVFYSDRQNENGQWETGIDGLKWDGPLDQIKKNTRLTLMAGAGDQFGWDGVSRAVYDALLLDGFVHVAYIEAPKLGHNLPDASWFEKGVAALESKPKTPPVTSPTNDPHPLPGQVAQAKRILTSAQIMLNQKKKGNVRLEENAKKYLQRVLDEYPTTSAAPKARELLNELNQK
jgi:hypothetical protein